MSLWSHRGTSNPMLEPPGFDRGLRTWSSRGRTPMDTTHAFRHSRPARWSPIQLANRTMCSLTAGPAHAGHRCCRHCRRVFQAFAATLALLHFSHASRAGSKTWLYFEREPLAWCKACRCALYDHPVQMCRGSPGSHPHARGSRQAPLQMRRSFRYDRLAFERARDRPQASSPRREPSI